MPGFNRDTQFDGQMTYVNMWDKLIPTASIQNLANSCGTEVGNVMQWPSFLAALAHGDVQYSVYSSIFPKGMELKLLSRVLTKAHTPTIMSYKIKPIFLSCNFVSRDLPVRMPKMLIM